MRESIWSRFLKTNRTFLIVSLIAWGCQRVPDEIEPTISFAVQDKYLLALPTAFPSLSAEERSENWGKEMLIGAAFAQQLDLYQAITAFKRAAILIPPENIDRALQIQYEILLCYYIGKKPDDVIYTFENSPLSRANTDFPALHDLLLILYDTYLAEKMERKAERILLLIQHYYPEEADQLQLSTLMQHGEISTLAAVAAAPPPRPYLNTLLTEYADQKKSVGQAQLYNALIPGAGYLYLGQTQSAITALVLNGLFITASTYFFKQGNIAAGAIFTSFEAGWYFGGIYGAGLEAKAYNERLYEQMATPVMNQEKLFPVLRLKYAF